MLRFSKRHLEIHSYTGNSNLQEQNKYRSSFNTVTIPFKEETKLIGLI